MFYLVCDEHLSQVLSQGEPYGLLVNKPDVVREFQSKREILFHKQDGQHLGYARG